MAGYVFSINDSVALKEIVETGVYSTNMTIPKNNIWNVSHEGTFSDYLTMQKGDNVYFFHKRQLYGIGELVNMAGDCKFLNFPDADKPVMPYNYSGIKKDMLLYKVKENMNNRVVCMFKGSPFLFKNGVDMDEVLSSQPDRFKMLRAFWKLSFIKIDDEENKALRDVILKNNAHNLNNQQSIFNWSNHYHQRIKRLVNKDYYVRAKKIMGLCARDDGRLKHEMAIEAGLLDTMTNRRDTIFGTWDYLSHQVVASPFKPVEYMDKMDIFGYHYLPGFDTITNYLVIEIKKDTATVDDIRQVMKYVDWINYAYSHGDYRMVCAFLVAFDFPKAVIKERENIAIRNYTKSRRPPVTERWTNLRLIKYTFNQELNELKFTEL